MTGIGSRLNRLIPARAARWWNNRRLPSIGCGHLDGGVDVGRTDNAGCLIEFLAQRLTGAFLLYRCPIVCREYTTGGRCKEYHHCSDPPYSADLSFARFVHLIATLRFSPMLGLEPVSDAAAIFT